MNLSATPFQVAQDMSSFVYNQFEYKQGITSVETKLDEVWNLKAGVCQDFAHILIGDVTNGRYSFTLCERIYLSKE